MLPENHETSLAVWDLVSPLVVGCSATIKVGAKCSAGCSLADHEIEIHDQSGDTITGVRLGPEPLPGTTGLYWAEANFASPALPGTHAWAVVCAHGDASSHFSFITVPPPDHTVHIRVREKKTQAAIAGAEVRLGVYRATSDAQGVATLEVTKGPHNVTVWKLGYTHHSTMADIADSFTIDVDIEVEPEPKQPYWM
jgi:hypothetical protein